MESSPLSSVSCLEALAGNVLPVEPRGADRRRNLRYPCEGAAQVFVPHGALLFEGRILNLSLSGCFIETPTLKLERGTRVEVSFHTHRMSFRMAGHIAVLRRGHGAGIAFHGVSERRARQVSDLLRELQEGAGA